MPRGSSSLGGNPGRVPADAPADGVLEALHATTLALLDRVDPDGLLRDIAERAAALVGATEGSIYLIEKDGGLVVRATVGPTISKYNGMRLELGEGIAGRVAASGQPVVVDDYSAWAGRSDKILRTDVHAAAAFPLRARGAVVGVLGLYHTTPGRRFDPDAVHLLRLYAQLASVALDHARLVRETVESEALFRVAFEHAPIGRAIVSPDGRWVRVNAALERMLGRSEDELAELTFLDVTHPEDREANGKLYRSVLSGETSGYEMQKRFVRKDGSSVWAHTTVSLVRDEAGRPLWFIGDVQDLTSRRQAEEVSRTLGVTRTLVRRMLEDLARRTPLPSSAMRDLGRGLAERVEGEKLAAFLGAFGSMGLGALRLDEERPQGYEVSGSDLLEISPGAAQPTCHLCLGFVEGAVAKLTGRKALGTELRCGSLGHERCVFVVRIRP